VWSQLTNPDCRSNYQLSTQQTTDIFGNLWEADEFPKLDTVFESVFEVVQPPIKQVQTSIPHSGWSYFTINFHY